MSYPTIPRSLGTLRSASAADSDTQSTFEAAHDADDAGGIIDCRGSDGIVTLACLLSGSAADTAAIRLYLYTVDSDGDETLIGITEAQTVTARSMTNDTDQMCDFISFVTYGFAHCRVHIDSISAGTLTVDGWAS
jgi:hypothetical protein